MKKDNVMVYISHKFGGKQENMFSVERHIENLVNKYDKITPISPIHNTGFLYNLVTYQKGISFCLDLLKNCDIMVTFGEDSNSKGCMIEKEYCRNNNIPIVDEKDFDNWYKLYFGCDNDE